MPLRLRSFGRTLTTADTNGNAAQTTFEVTVLPDPFITYLTNAGVPAPQRTITADPDSDGIPNLLEYALGLAPLTCSTYGLPVIAESGGILTLTYQHAQSDISYTFQFTTDLTNSASWTSVGVNQGIPSANGTTTASRPLDIPRRFLRLHITYTSE